MNKSTSARELRQRRKAEYARLLLRLLGLADITQEELADACGVSRQVAQRWADRNSGRAIDMAGIALAPREVGRHLVQELAEAHGLMLVEKPSHERDIGTLREVVEKALPFVEVYARAVADGHITPAEAEEVHRAANTMIDCGVKIANAAKAILRDHRNGGAS